MRAVSAIVALALTSGCGLPSVAHTDTRIEQVDLDQVQGEVVFTVDNPWPIGCTLTGFSYDLRLQDTPVIQGMHHEGLRIPARDRVEVGLPVTVRWQDVRQAAGALRGADEVPWSVQGSVGVSTLLGEARIPLGYEGSLPVLHPPRIGVQQVRFGRGPEGGVGMAMDLHLTSLTGLAYGVESLTWRLDLGGQPVAGGAARTHLVDPRTTALTLEVLLDPFAAAGAVGRLMAGYEVQAAVALGARLSTPLGVLPLDTTVHHVLAWR